MNKLIILLFLFCFSSTKAYDYPVSDIPDSLKTDAASVIRDYSINFTQNSVNSGNYTISKSITILNKQGDEHANFSFGGDKFRELTKFSATIRNASGNIIRKIKKGDLTYSTIDTQSLASDNYVMAYNFQSPSYPFTVEYSYEVKCNNGIIAYPSFYPISNFRQSCVKASYKIELPLEMGLRYKSNLNIDLVKKSSEKSSIYSIETYSIKALPIENYMPLGKDLLPSVLFAPSNFCYDSSCGDMSTWKEYGAWVYKLLEGRDVLSADLVSKLKEMTKDIKDEREKVKIIYEYLQNNSRYVSIQLGIGGLQPIEASKVAKSRFGDCKGLSNLMKAMLKAIDIPSYYCEIYSGTDKELFSDFSNIQQTNHVILLVPLKNDSVWLECTNQTLPFGFIHKNIVGHDALVITENGGKLCRIPSYPNNKRKTETKLMLDIKEDGNINGRLEVIEYLDAAWSVGARASEERKVQVDYINSSIKLPKMNIGDISIISDNVSEPSTLVKTSFEAADFINKTGNRLFIPIYPINKGNFKVFSSNKRELDIYIDETWASVHFDTIDYKFPNGYVLESLPKNINIETQFGSLKIQVKQIEKGITYTQQLELKPGKYDKSSYLELKDFFAQIDSSLKRKLVLRKE